jgi:chromosome segregation ATPase
MKENIKNDLTKIFDAAKLRVAPEVKALEEARRQRDKINELIRTVSIKEEAARIEQDRLAEVVTHEIENGNEPNAQIAAAALKREEVKTYTSQVERLSRQGNEADRAVTAAAKALEDALWKELPEARNAVEELAMEPLREAARYLTGWSEMLDALYAGYGVQASRKASTRLRLFFDLLHPLKRLEPFIDEDVDPMYASARKQSLGL